jgi:hypothetical protein
MAPAAPLLLLLSIAVAAARLFRIPLDTNSSFSWTLDYPAGTVSVEVHCPGDRDHWVAVGFSAYGALRGADLCVLWRDWRGYTHLQVRPHILTDRDSRLHYHQTIVFQFNSKLRNPCNQKMQSDDRHLWRENINTIEYEHKIQKERS